MQTCVKACDSLMAFILKAGIEDIAKSATFFRVVINLSFSEKKDNAQRLYANFVAEGVGKESIWSNLKQQIFLGHDDFISTVQGKAKGLSFDNNIPKVQQLPPSKPLQQIVAMHKSRNAAIIAAYQTGAYSYSQIADHFNLHFTTVGRIIRTNRKVP